MAGERAGVPDWEEISLLPVKAKVAFAARCARRMLPYLGRSSHTFSTVDLDAIEKAIRISEEYAAEANDFRLITLGEAMAAGSRVGRLVYGLPHLGNAPIANAIALAAYTAVMTVAAALAVTDVHTARAARDNRGDRANRADRDAILRAIRAARDVSDDATRAATDFKELADRSPELFLPFNFSEDLGLLQLEVSKRYWYDSWSFPTTLFPPITEAVPEKQPVEDLDPAPPLSLLFEVGTLTPFEIQEVISLVGEMYHGLTGDKLIIDSTDTFEPAASLVPQGGLS